MNKYFHRPLNRQRPGMLSYGYRPLFSFLALALMLTFLHVDLTNAEEPSRSMDKIIAVIPEDGPPSFYRDKKSGEAAGFTVDISNEIARRAGFSIAYKFAKNWDAIRDIIQRGDADIGPGLSISPERMQYYSFSEPFDIFTISFFVRSGTGITELRQGASVGVIRGSVAYELLYPKQDIQLIPYENFQTGLFDLLAGKIDSFAGPAPVFWRLAMDTRVEDRITTVGKPIAEAKRAFGVRKDRTELTAQLNKALDGFVGSPEYQRIYSKWYGKPGPFIALSKQTVWMIITFSILLIAMTVWRYMSIIGLARKLQKEISERKKTGAALRESEEIFRNFMEYSPIYVFFKDKNIRSIRLSRNYEALLGKPVAELLGKSMDELFPSELAKGMIADDMRILNEDKTITVEEKFNGRSYTTIKFPIHIAGKPLYLAGYTIDITERKLAEEQLQRSLREKEVLLKEIHHRVKNNMNVICSLLNLQAKGTTDKTVHAIFEEAENRVRSMAMIHEKLYSSRDLAHIDFKEYLTGLISGIAESYKRHDVVFSVDMGPVALDVNIAIPCGLIVNELVSNSLKYAFPDGRKGTIRVGINKNNEGGYVLFVKDNGIGFPVEVDYRDTKSLGLQLVNVLTKQINGAIELSNAEGTGFSITFPRYD